MPFQIYFVKNKSEIQKLAMANKFFRAKVWLVE